VNVQKTEHSRRQQYRYWTLTIIIKPSDITEITTALEDDVWKVYLLGTKEEIRKPEEPNYLRKFCFAQAIGTGLTARYILPLITTPYISMAIGSILLADLTCRVVRSRKTHEWSLCSGPGLLGTTREFYKNRKRG